MRIWIILIFIPCILSCTGNPGVSRELSGSDSIIIHFYEAGSGAIIKTVSTTERKAINRVTEFISGKEKEGFTCGYDGNILFFEKGKPASDVSFNFSDESCRHFILDVKGKLVSTRMSNEAADFLKGLKSGASTY